MDFMVNHYTDTVIHSVDKIIRGLKYELKQKIDKLKKRDLLDRIFNNF